MDNIGKRFRCIKTFKTCLGQEVECNKGSSLKIINIGNNTSGVWIEVEMIKGEFTNGYIAKKELQHFESIVTRAKRVIKQYDRK